MYAVDREKDPDYASRRRDRQDLTVINKGKVWLARADDMLQDNMCNMC